MRKPRQWCSSVYGISADQLQALAARTCLLASLVRRSPHVLLVPLLLFSLMTALGTWGVIKAKQETELQARKNAVVDADAASQALQLALQRTTLPLTQLSEVVKLTPRWQQFEQQFGISMPSIWRGATNGTFCLVVTPMAVARAVYPPNVTQPLNTALLYGANTLYPPLRELTLVSLRTKSMTFEGPAITDNKYLVSMISQPVFFPNVAQNDTFDYRFNDKLCTPGLCYDNTTQTRWWGTLSLLIDADAIFGPEGPLHVLAHKYKYQLWQPPVPGLVSNVLEAVGGGSIAGILGKALPMQVRANEGEGVADLVPMISIHGNQTEPDNTIIATVPVLNQMMELHVWKDSWAPAWMLPLIAVVVIGAFIVSALLLSTLSSWEEHRALLHSLLPKETIARMRNEAKWAADEQNDALKTIRLETPAELMLRIIDDCIGGRSPDLPLLLSVRDALHRSADVYRPNEQQMRDKMDELTGLDDDVRNALTAQLMGGAQSFGAAVAQHPDALRLASKADLEHKHPSSQLSGLDAASQLTSFSGGATSSVPAILELDISNSNARVLASSNSTQYAEQCGQLVDGGGSKVWAVLAHWQLQAPDVAKSILNAAQASNAIGDSTASAPLDEALPTPVAVVMKPILTQLERVLVSAGEWSFDAYALDEASHGRPLSCLGFWLLHSTGIKTWARMHTKRLTRFLERVEEGYANNPYHNRRHAADVLQSVHVLMHKAGLVPGFADQLTLLGCYLAAIVHDFEHVGRTNDFLVNSSDDLAVRYNDRSPMENHHLAAAWALLKAKDCNILSGLSRAEVVKLRKLVIDLVLATDMKQHFAIVGQFETMTRQAQDQTGEGSHHGEDRSIKGSSKLRVLGHNMKPVNDQDQLLSLQMMLKCADLGHISAPLEVHLRWVSALEAEFFLQGDEEKALGLLISPLCDRNKEGVTKSQIGFFDFVVLPIFKNFAQRFPEAGPLLTAVHHNLAYWKTTHP